MTLKKSLFAAVVAVGAVVAMSETSDAFFGWGRGGGSCGSYGGWGGGSYGGWGGSYGGWGGSHGGWGGTYGGWGSHGGWAGYGSAGSWGGHGSYGGGYAVVDHGHFARRTHHRHHHRRFVSVEPQVTHVVAAAPASTKTTLTLHVPADAKVTLAGVTTKQQGEVRRFTTTRLSEGQVWDDYTVVVELDHGGQTLREERTISLTGGRSQELAIELDSTQLAQR